jgi:hypothetical protein
MSPDNFVLVRVHHSNGKGGWLQLHTAQRLALACKLREPTPPSLLRLPAGGRQRHRLSCRRLPFELTGCGRALSLTPPTRCEGSSWPTMPAWSMPACPSAIPTIPGCASRCASSLELALRRGGVLLFRGGNRIPPKGRAASKYPGLSAALVQKESARNSGGWISIKLKAGVLLTSLLRVGDGENK